MNFLVFRGFFGPNLSMLNTQWVPAARSQSRRTMVVLHGLGDSAAGFTWLPAALDLPWLNYLLVNAPDPYYGGFSWYAIEGDPGPGIERSRALLFEQLAAQRARGFPAEQTVIFGFSQGCLMTLELGIRSPHRFAGLVGVSGYVFDCKGLLAAAAPVAPQQRFLVTHGSRDPLLPLAQVQPEIRRLQAAGLNLAWHVLDKEHTLAGETELALIRDFIRAGYPDE